MSRQCKCQTNWLNKPCLPYLDSEQQDRQNARTLQQRCSSPPVTLHVIAHQAHISHSQKAGLRTSTFVTAGFIQLTDCTTIYKKQNNEKQFNKTIRRNVSEPFFYLQQILSLQFPKFKYCIQTKYLREPKEMTQ